MIKSDQIFESTYLYYNFKDFIVQKLRQGSFYKILLSEEENHSPQILKINNFDHILNSAINRSFIIIFFFN